VKYPKSIDYVSLFAHGDIAAICEQIGSREDGVIHRDGTESDGRYSMDYNVCTL
jgi:hypothetical protein